MSDYRPTYGYERDEPRPLYDWMPRVSTGGGRRVFHPYGVWWIRDGMGEFWHIGIEADNARVDARRTTEAHWHFVRWHGDSMVLEWDERDDTARLAAGIEIE